MYLLQPIIRLAKSLSSGMKLERRRREAHRNQLNLLVWGQRYLPDHFQLTPSPMHRWLAERLDRMPIRRGQMLNCIGPRGSAKSTVVTLAAVLRAAVGGAEPYIWIVSDTAQQASRHLANVRAELEQNEALARDYPEATGQGPIWRNTTLVLANGVTIESLGTGQRIRGARRRQHRPTFIVCDDLQNDGHIQSALLRQHSREWFQGTLLKAGTRKTNIVNLATALHPEALALELSRTPGWTSRTFQSVVRWPTNQALWRRWEKLYTDLDNEHRLADARAFYEEHRIEMEAGADVLWPEQEDLYTLQCLLIDGGRAAFDREKQGSPHDPALCEWPAVDFDEKIWFDHWPARVVVKVIALDPSQGKSDANARRRGDYSALVLLAIDEAGYLYLDADIRRRPVAEMIDATVEHCQTFRPHALGVEANQFQELLAGELERALVRRGLYGVATFKIDNRVNKHVRIRRLGPHLSRKRLRFKRDSPGAELLVKQLRLFPIGDHDDGPDAAEMALRLALELLHGRNANDGLGERLVMSDEQ